MPKFRAQDHLTDENLYDGACVFGSSAHNVFHVTLLQGAAERSPLFQAMSLPNRGVLSAAPCRADTFEVASRAL